MSMCFPFFPFPEFTIPVGVFSNCLLGFFTTSHWALSKESGLNVIMALLPALP